MSVRIGLILIILLCNLPSLAMLITMKPNQIKDRWALHCFQIVVAVLSSVFIYFTVPDK